MSNRYTEVVILAEDERSANLLRRYALRVLHLDNRRIRQEISPPAQGDAKQWVIRQYSIEVNALRKVHRHTGLIVHLDADTDVVADRSRQLAASLRNDGQVERESSERISHAIPRRHTETWLCMLTGEDVNEDQDCKREHRLPDFDRVVQPAARALYDLTRPNAPEPVLPSLATAVPELRRLEK